MISYISNPSHLPLPPAGAAAAVVKIILLLDNRSSKQVEERGEK